MVKPVQMKKSILLVTAFVASLLLNAQKKDKQINLGIMNVQSAMPFGKFAGMFSDQFHPGIEGGVAMNWKTKQKHDWIQQFEAGYFFHRFVQHGIFLQTDFGYRYKFSNRFSSQATIGAGYLHSIPATAKLKLNSNGEYENNKGIGRAQAMADLAFRVDWKFCPSSKKPKSIFIQYQQLLQMPFIKSYVPVLPYNCFVVGVSYPFAHKK